MHSSGRNLATAPQNPAHHLAQIPPSSSINAPQPSQSFTPLVPNAGGSKDSVQGGASRKLDPQFQLRFNPETIADPQQAASHTGYTINSISISIPNSNTPAEPNPP